MSIASATSITDANRNTYNHGKFSLIIGLIGLAVASIGLYSGLTNEGPEASRPFYSWLIAFGYWVSIAIGMLILIMMTYLFDSGWTTVIRRQLEHGITIFKWLAIMFLPLLIIAVFIKPDALWPWLDISSEVPGGHGTIKEDTLYQSKASFLNPKAFLIFNIIFFAVVIGIAESLRRHSFAMDEDGDLRHFRICQRLSSAGIFLIALALTFGSIYWFKSLEYHWFSTMYGVWFFAASVWAAIATTIVMLHYLSKKGALKGFINSTHYYFLGCLLLAFTIFWTYISISQYFLIYNANIPEETFWYHIRELSWTKEGMVKNSWWAISMLLIFAHFFTPFLFLLWYKNKFGRRLLFISFFALILHLIDLYWNILPGKIASHENPLHYVIRQFDIVIWDISALIGIGGICIWAFLRSTRSTAPIPLRDPRINESINAHE